MRIILLSIAFIFCAFSAQSQVLKSAGVWYFLDVDSMTARPAVLPNGTELAYVVGTKKIYYWDRTASTWTEYSTGGGSSFNRDSIYFDASIIGSGTVSDPWGVDSTLFATIAAVGDSIAAAVANYFPLEGGTLTGTGGAGFIGLPSQGVAPGTPASGLNIFAQGSSFNWKGTDGFERQITSSLTGGRNYALPDINGTFALGTGTADRSARWTGTNTLAAGNLSDNATRLAALLPWQFHSWTTAGRPTGVNNYWGYNSTTDWLEGYLTSAGAWISPLQSSLTGGKGTATRLLFNDANGRATDNAQLVFNSSTGVTTMSNGTDNITFDNSNSSGFPEIQFFNAGISQVYLLASNWTSGRNGITFSTTANASSLASIRSLSLETSNVYGLQSLEIFALSGVTPYIRMFRQGAVDFRQEVSSSGTMKWYDFDASQNYFSFDKTNVRVGVLTAAPNYKFDINSTGAMGLPRGTVAQRPTIITSTTPFRYNTDSTALEYGESVGTWRQLATRAYARSLVSALPTTNIYTADGTLASNRTITSGGFNLRYTGNFSVGSSSAPARTLDVTGEVRISDLTTDTPTQIVGADGDGDIGAMTVGSGITIVAGALGLAADSLEQNAGVLYVSKNGNNSTAKRNNPRLPFLTIKAATQAARDGDLVYIYPGVYREGGTTLGKDSINFYCSPGVTVSNAVITDDYGTADMNNGGYIRWFGSGVFDSCIVSIQWMNMRYHIEGDSINLDYVPFWKGSNYNDISLKFKFRSVRTKRSQLVFFSGASSEISYTRMNLIFEIDRIFSNEATRSYPLIHFTNGAGGTDSDAKSKFIDCNLMFDIKNIELSGDAAIGANPRLEGLVFGPGAVTGRVHLSRSNLYFNSNIITQTGSAGNTYETPFQEIETSNTLFGVGTFKLDSSKINFNVKSIISDLHAFRLAEFWQGNQGEVNITGNFTTRALATFHVEDAGSGADGDSTLVINIDGNFTSDKEVVTCRSTVPIEKITWRGSYASFADKAVFAIKSDSFTLSSAVLKNNGTTADVYAAEARTIKVAGAYVDGLNLSSNVSTPSLQNLGSPILETYYEITSTSSPQTLSNTYSDNLINQGGTQASFTFLFPASPADGQILSITWGNAISTLTLDGNGETITGSAVTTAVAGTRRQFKYYASAATWIKIY